MSVDDHVADLSGGVVRSPSAHCCVFLFLCSRYGGLVSGNHFTSCVFVSGECVFMGRWGGGGIPGNASLTDQFLWQPGNDSCSWNPVEGGVGREKNVHLLYFVSVFPVNDTALLPFPPPPQPHSCV